MTVILMSRSEIDRMNVLLDLVEERIRVSEAVALEQAPSSGACLHRREAEGAGHVAVGQGTAATWPAQSHVQGRIAPSKTLQPRNQERRLPFTPKTVTFVTGAKSDFSKWRRDAGTHPARDV